MLDILNLESLEPRARERLDPMLFEELVGGRESHVVQADISTVAREKRGAAAKSDPVAGMLAEHSADPAGDHDSGDRKRSASGQRGGGHQNGLAGDRNAGALDEQKERDQDVAVLGDPLADDVKHPSLIRSG